MTETANRPAEGGPVQQQLPIGEQSADDRSIADPADDFETRLAQQLAERQARRDRIAALRRELQVCRDIGKARRHAAALRRARQGGRQ